MIARMKPYFNPELFSFLRELRENNDREWFAANKGRYEKDVRDPVLRFISDFGVPLTRISSHLVADPRPVGGSMFRIYRDTRFSRDKSPYKTHVGVHFFHEKAKKAPSVPGFYLHLEPDKCFAAAGIWHPDPTALLRVREAIASSSPEWKAVKRSGLPIEGGTLKRPPRGFDPEHKDIDALKRTDFVFSTPLKNVDVCSSSFLNDFAAHCRRMAPIAKLAATALKLVW